jgi:hypothetical protein
MFYTEPALAYRETVLSRQLLILLISSLEWYIAEKISYLLLEMENFEQSITSPGGSDVLWNNQV